MSDLADNRPRKTNEQKQARRDAAIVAHAMLMPSPDEVLSMPYRPIPTAPSLLRDLKGYEIAAQRESYMVRYIDPLITDTQTVIVLRTLTVLRDTIATLRVEVSQLCERNEDLAAEGKLRVENNWIANDEAYELLNSVVHSAAEEDLSDMEGQELRRLLLQAVQGWIAICELNKNMVHKKGKELKDVEVGESS